MAYREPIKVIADILKSELSLSNGQILLQYQKNFIPQGTNLYISLAYISDKIISNANYFLHDTLEEQQRVVSQYLIQIDALSFGSEARTRKEEIVAALKSIRSQQLQEKYNLQIARIPTSFVNTASLEETKFLDRHTITIAVTAIFVKTKELTEYYDQFREPEVKVR